jgi:integrase
MSGRSVSVPSYRLHKQSGQAVVTLPDGLGGRHDVLLGVYGSTESRTEYARVIAEWETAGRRLVASNAVAGVSVNELIFAFWKHAEQHYRRADGTTTNELYEFQLSLKPLKAHYGLKLAAKFGPLALKAVRRQMLDANLCRRVVNQRIGRIKRVFKWGVAEELVPPGVFQALQAVTGIPPGRGLARETEPIGPVPNEYVDAVQPFVLPSVWSMVELQRATGMRPGEVCQMRPVDIDMSGVIWIYRPSQHKTSWRGKKRIIALGPRAQKIVRENLPLNIDDFLFSPRRALEARSVRLRADRKTPVQPSQQHRRRVIVARSLHDRYEPHSYARAIARACMKANKVEWANAKEAAKRAGKEPQSKDHVFVPHWHPNQLRHNHATEVRRRYGLEAAGAALGHSKLSATEIYAERDMALAERVAREIG